MHLEALLRTPLPNKIQATSSRWPTLTNELVRLVGWTLKRSRIDSVEAPTPKRIQEEETLKRDKGQTG